MNRILDLLTIMCPQAAYCLIGIPRAVANGMKHDLMITYVHNFGYFAVRQADRYACTQN